MSALGWLSEKLKLDAGMEYQALAVGPAGILSRYFPLREWGRAALLAIVDTLAVTEQVVLTAVGAQDAAGTGAANIATASATIVANTHATVVDIVMAGGNVGDTVRIDSNDASITFTAAAAADPPNHVWDQSGAPAAEAISLAACINHAAAAALGITATVVGVGLDTVRLTVDEPGDTDITVVSSAPARQVPATVLAIGIIELTATALVAGDDYVALRVVGPVTANGLVVVMRGDARYAPATQHVAASDTDT